MKKLISVALVLMLLLALAAPVLAVSGSVSLSASNKTLYRGDTFSVTATLSSSDAIGLCSVTLSYDTSVFELVDGSCHVAGVMMGIVDKGSNSGLFVFQTDPVVVSGKIFTFNFKVKDTAAFGTYTISSQSSIGVDTGSPISSGSATVTVACNHSYGGWTQADNADHQKTCSICGDVQKEAHGWDAGTVTKNPSCAEVGEKSFSCSVCNGTKTEEVDKTTDHSYGDWSKTDDTNHTHTCSICNGTESVPHTWNSGVVTKPATCKEEGVTTYTCTAAGCGATYTTPIAKTEDHKFGNLTAVDDENHKDTCSVCQKEITQAHTYDSGKVTKEATCKEEGVTTYTCSGCKHTKTTPIAKTEDHKFGNLTAVDDTNHKDTCSVCKKEITQAHTYDGGKVTKPATCKEEGVTTYTCSGCKHTMTTPIAKTEDHKYGTWQNVDGDKHKHICSVCQKEETAAHTWNNGAVTKKATCKEPGETTYTCTGCGATYTTEISKTEDHKFGAWTSVDETNHSRSCTVCEKTETAAHGYKTSWSKDKSEHWHACSDCGNKKDVAAHTPGAEATEKNPQTCTVCKYVIKPALGHTHKWADTLTTDENGHYYTCSGCEEHKDEAAHDFANACDGQCETCGYTRQTAHAFGTEWVSDASGHWYACTVCGEKSDFAEHAPGTEASEFTAQTCTACGYELVAALGHSFSNDWNSDEENHWHDCDCGEKDALGAHTWNEGEDADDGIVYTCTVCGAQKTEAKPFNWTWVIIGAAAIAVVLIVILLIVKKKKN